MSRGAARRVQGWLNPIFMLPSLRRDIRSTPEEESVPGPSFKRASQKRGGGNLALKDGIPGRGEEQEYSRWREQQ